MTDKTLYISDLDGTLLRRDQTVSPYTVETVNTLLSRGIHFSYATARSGLTARKITAALHPSIPVILYNGTFIAENKTGRILKGFSFTKEQSGFILDTLAAGGVHPFVYAHVDEIERFSFSPDHLTEGMRHFLGRNKDERPRPVPLAQMGDGEVFHFSCIDDPEKLTPLHEALRDQFPTVLYKEIYSDCHWLELNPPGVSKASAVRLLRDMLGCDRIVAFGDGLNDIPMFEVADECYAPANAEEALKAIATGIIPSNEEDGVAHWLRENAL